MEEGLQSLEDNSMTRHQYCVKGKNAIVTGAGSGTQSSPLSQLPDQNLISSRHQPLLCRPSPQPWLLRPDSRPLSASRSPETHQRPQRDGARKTTSHLPQDRCNRVAAIIPHVRNRHQRIRQHRHCVSRRRHLRPALVKLLAPTGHALGPKQRLSEVCKSRY
jgi:hypothetical protein